MNEGRQKGVAVMIDLIRHAAHADVGRRLTGRSEGKGLTESGRAQAAALARRLGSGRYAAVEASPLLRTWQTAEALRPCCGGADVRKAEALIEIDFGDWTGRDFAELEGDVEWRRWNSSRGSARAPGGERMADVQKRVVGHLQSACARYADGAETAMVSHSDVIRAALAHFLGLDLDNVLNFDIEPASVSRLVVGDWGGRVISMNETGER